MRTLCRDCGHGNQLGALFCRKCGVKLDLTNIGDEIEQGQKGEQRKALVKLAWIPVAVVALVVAVMAAWPHRAIGRDGLQPDSRVKIDTAVDIMAHYARTGVEAETTPLAEADINSWLLQVARDRNVESISAGFRENEMDLRVVDSVGPFKLFEGKVTLPAVRYSLDVVIRPVSNMPHVAMCRLGHLPLPGPAKRPVLKYMDQKILKGMDRERMILEKIAKIQIGKQQVTIGVKAGD